MKLLLARVCVVSIILLVVLGTIGSSATSDEDNSCSLALLKHRAINACEDLFNAVNNSLDLTEHGYRIIESSIDHRPKRSKMRKTKKVRKDDYPENGYLIIFHPYTKLFKHSNKQRKHKYMSNHWENSVHNDYYVDSMEDMRHHKAYNPYRFKRSFSIPPALEFCCKYPTDRKCGKHVCIG